MHLKVLKFYLFFVFSKLKYVKCKKRLKIYIFLFKEKKIKTQDISAMKTSNGLKTAMLKKKLSGSGTSTNQQTSQMNKTSLSSISSSSLKSQEKLSQLKQKLQKQRENMRKSGRRFKENSQTSTQIQIQTQQLQIKPVTTKQFTNSTKKSSAVSTSTSTATNLYDFNTVKLQAQTKTNRLFMKKAASKKNDQIVPVYTTQQILDSTSGKGATIGKSGSINSAQSKVQKVPLCQLKRQTVNLMQLSAVIQKSPTKINKNSKQKQNPLSEIKFLDPSTLKKSTIKSQNSDILANSRVFQSAIKQQKQRNKEVEDFLSQVGLQQFTQSFINLGYDEVETLIEVEVDDLNQIMMRAKQQYKLMQLIKDYKIKHKIQNQPQKPLIQKPSFIKSNIGYRPKSAALTTQPSQSNSTAQNSRLRSITQNFSMGDSTLMSKSSIFYAMGGSEWSLESQIRKACSGCFKLSQDALKRGDCYYCDKCDPGELDSLEISLNQSMVRSYY